MPGKYFIKLYVCDIDRPFELTLISAFLLGILTREDGTDTLSRNVGK
jgi:hypothetical protein